MGQVLVDKVVLGTLTGGEVAASVVDYLMGTGRRLYPMPVWHQEGGHVYHDSLRDEDDLPLNTFLIQVAIRKLQRQGV